MDGHLATVVCTMYSITRQKCKNADVLIVEKLISVRNNNIITVFLEDFLAFKCFYWRRRQIMQNSLIYAPLAQLCTLIIA